jgi:hypothetical protein
MQLWPTWASLGSAADCGCRLASQPSGSWLLATGLALGLPPIVQCVVFFVSLALAYKADWLVHQRGAGSGLLSSTRYHTTAQYLAECSGY